MKKQRGRRKAKDYTAIFAVITRNQEALMAEYAGFTHYIPEVNKWDFAIPENYTNYQDGFLMPDFKEHRGMALFDHPKVGRLYLRWDVPYYALKEGEKEKYLCFDRHGNKHTVVIAECPQQEIGNPSYFRFLPRVKKYIPRQERLRKREVDHV